MKHRIFLAVPVLLGVGVAGFALAKPMVSSSTASRSAGKTFNTEASEKRANEAAPLVKAQNAFGARLLERLESSNAKHENLLASPTSLWQALALTRGGAVGRTKAQMGTLLSLGTLSDAGIGPANRAFNALLAEQKGASISVANSLWLSNAFKPNPAYVKASSDNFGAGVHKFDESNPQGGAALINGWVSDHTKKEINDIVTADDLKGQSALLVNAVYFRGGWTETFDRTETKPAPFHLAGGQTVSLPMMNGEREHAYLAGKSFEGARLPYSNTNCALWVLLPKAGKTPANVLRELGEEKHRLAHPGGSVALSLPRFDIEWRDNVVAQLAQMNAPLPFSSGADFSAMGKPAFGISLVLHVCKMRVDEEGTVAAAATVVGMAGGAAPAPQKPHVLKFNGPFVVALVEETSGAHLFEGTVYDPRAKG